MVELLSKMENAGLAKSSTWPAPRRPHGAVLGFQTFSGYPKTDSNAFRNTIRAVESELVRGHCENSTEILEFVVRSILV